MNEYRPPGLINPFPIEIINPILKGAAPTAFMACETGFSLMLAALREKGRKIDPGIELSLMWQKYSQIQYVWFRKTNYDRASRFRNHSAYFAI